MKFNDEKKKSIILYLLEKIEQKEVNPSQIVSEAFNINRNTVHTYINQLVSENVIKRVKRGIYELIETTYEYSFSRSKEEIKNETHIYNLTLKQHIEEFSSNIQEIWEYAFSEMVNNVIDHSEAKNMIIIIKKNFLNTRVFIADNGIGIFEKIKNYFELPTLDDAICELFKGKLTTDKANHSGEGIFFSSKLMDNFAIFSDDKIFTTDKFHSSNIISFPNEKDSAATVVMMKLSNYSHKKSKEVFDKYSDVDGGFTKTIIPLKNVFDASPVSRSQARRILSSLDKFKEIVLDFDMIEWIGQGFAHQIFVVFKNQQPQIQIIPVNMNEDVTKMYYHVINTEAGNT
ncbi:MAG: DUF4325 domain-containing protein [Ruminococcaceae bacterium]|nr:DUF4325 domain-containing protein [Oscillospiraceae bacterium]